LAGSTGDESLVGYGSTAGIWIGFDRCSGLIGGLALVQTLTQSPVHCHFSPAALPP
jgi:hypothetical protein